MYSALQGWSNLVCAPLGHFMSGKLMGLSFLAQMRVPTQ
jgi:hypothetical protein